MVPRRRATVGKLEELESKVKLLEREVLDQIYKQKSLMDEITALEGDLQWQRSGGLDKEAAEEED